MGDDAEAKQPKKPRYDTFAKEALGETLELLGTVSTHHEIAAEPQFGDLWFEPHPNPTTTHEPLMVLIARMARTPALFEPFSTRPSDIQLRDVMGKALVLDRVRRTTIERTRQSYVLGHTWILVPKISRALLARAEAKPDIEWGPGFYAMPELTGTHIVIIRELPEVPETLLLRLMGRDGTLKRAVHELAEHSEALAQRWSVLADRWLRLVHEHTLRAEEQNMIPPEAIEEVKRLVELRYTQARLEGKTEGRLEGQQEGLLRGKRNACVILLTTRFEVDEDIWTQRFAAITDPAVLDNLLKTIGTAEDIQQVEAALPQQAS